MTVWPETLFLNPELKAAEAYMDGRLTFEEGGHGL